MKSSLDLLKTIPDHPEANLAVGKFRSFVQGHWAAGVPHLALGSDKLLKDAALAEQDAAKDKANEVKAADAWWEFAQGAPEAEKRPAESRARHWYNRALATLTGPLPCPTAVAPPLAAGVAPPAPLPPPLAAPMAAPVTSSVTTTIIVNEPVCS